MAGYIGQGVLYTPRMMGPSALVLLSKTVSGKQQEEGQTESRLIYMDAKMQKPTDVIL